MTSLFQIFINQFQSGCYLPDMTTHDRKPYNLQISNIVLTKSEKLSEIKCSRFPFMNHHTHVITLSTQSINLLLLKLGKNCQILVQNQLIMDCLSIIWIHSVSFLTKNYSKYSFQKPISKMSRQEKGRNEKKMDKKKLLSVARRNIFVVKTCFSKCLLQMSSL